MLNWKRIVSFEQVPIRMPWGRVAAQDRAVDWVIFEPLLRHSVSGTNPIRLQELLSNSTFSKKGGGELTSRQSAHYCSQLLIQYIAHSIILASI